MKTEFLDFFENTREIRSPDDTISPEQNIQIPKNSEQR